MKALTLKQPYGSLLFTPRWEANDDGRPELAGLGLKTIETRTWMPRGGYRGDLLITVSKEPVINYKPLSHIRGICRWCGCTWDNACVDAKHQGCHWSTGYEDICSACSQLERSLQGHAIGVVEVHDSRPMTVDDERDACCQLYDRACSWFLKDPRPIEPFKIKGSLGIWESGVNLQDLTFLELPKHQIYGSYPKSAVSSYEAIVK